MEIEASTGSRAYLDLAEALLDAPTASPRGLETRELRDVTLVIEDPRRAHVLNTTRRPTLSIAATEGYQLLAGLSSLAQLDAASAGRFTRFADDGRLRGAYGPRLYAQLRRVARLLVEDPDTRQAVMSVWCGDELQRDSRDVPCTTALQFLLRDGLLHLRVTMRSNDAWLGLPYDLMMFSLLQRTVAAGLALLPGTYTHSVGSMHAYEPDLARLERVVEAGYVSPVFGSPLVAAGVPVPAPLGGPRDTPLADLDARLRLAEVICLRGGDSTWTTSPDAATAWVLGHVPQLPGDHELCYVCRYVMGPGHECGGLTARATEALDDLVTEYHRARVKHGPYSLDGEEIDDVRRLAALMEEVGEVAREMTYDHAGDLGAAARTRRELIQVANVALTWATVLPAGDVTKDVSAGDAP